MDEQPAPLPSLRVGDDTYYYADEDISISFQEKELEWLESHDLDLSNEIANEPLETSVTDIPPCLIHPFRETESALSSNEFESIDAVAAQYLHLLQLQPSSFPAIL